jgi:uncharacterized protein (DUF433 family)
MASEKPQFVAFRGIYPWRITMLDLINRITFNNNVLCGKPLIRGLRISVEMILELLARGATEEEILQDYPQLEPDDLRVALLYAHHMVDRENVFGSTGTGVTPNPVNRNQCGQ